MNGKMIAHVNVFLAKRGVRFTYGITRRKVNVGLSVPVIGGYVKKHFIVNDDEILINDLHRNIKYHLPRINEMNYNKNFDMKLEFCAEDGCSLVGGRLVDSVLENKVKVIFENVVRETVERRMF